MTTQTKHTTKNQRPKSVEKRLRSDAWLLFDKVESRQRELNAHSDPMKDDYLCDEDVVDVIEQFLADVLAEERERIRWMIMYDVIIKCDCERGDCEYCERAMNIIGYCEGENYHE